MGKQPLEKLGNVITGKNESNGSNEKHSSHSSNKSSLSVDSRIIKPRGDFQTLLSFQKVEVVCDITYRFAHKFHSRDDRTIDQMIQSARSSKQNILERSRAGTTSKETEI